MLIAALTALALLGTGRPASNLLAAGEARPLAQAFSCPVLDAFNRANGALGSAWSGQTANYAIASNQLDVLTGSTLDAGRIIWNAGAFGAAQQACVRLATIDTGANASVQLVLKNATSSDVSGRMMTVTFWPSTSVIRVETFDSASGWIQRGTDLTGVTFAAGDVLGARVLSSGTVEVYKNTTLLGTRDASAWSFISQTGWIGLRANNGPAFLLDDFGGGTVSGVAPTLTPTPTRTNTPVQPTNTPTRTNTPVSPTNTPVPATNTSLPPTSTPLPPTNTPVPPSSTPTLSQGGVDGYPGPDSVAGNVTVNSRLYLPVIASPGNRHTLQGVHLGSGIQQTWSGRMRSYLSGVRTVVVADPRDNDPGRTITVRGLYPAVIVVLSENVYQIRRSTTPPCYVQSVVGVRNQALYDYLKEASLSGSKVIVRIFPSPGNYTDAVVSGSWGRALITTADGRPRINPIQTEPGIPGDWCNPALGYDREFRNVTDLVSEMVAIRQYNAARGWTEFAFEPANEPNIEWLPSAAQQQTASEWSSMDAFFATLYDYKQTVNSSIQVLTAPMAQSAFAEAKNPIDCTDYAPGWPGGLAYMTNTWVTGAKIDGYSWHNYWISGFEASNFDGSCTSDSQHAFQAFPASVKNVIAVSPKPTFITEADLLSPCINPLQNLGTPTLADKGTTAIGSQNGGLAAQSILKFIRNNNAADYVAIWNASVAYNGNPLNCTPSGSNEEFGWHEGFAANDTNGTNQLSSERYWLRVWWLAR